MLDAGALQAFNQFRGLPPVFIYIAADDRALNAVIEMILEHLAFHVRQRHPHGSKLRRDIVAIFLEHARPAAHLAFNPVQTVEELGFVFAFYFADVTIVGERSYPKGGSCRPPPVGPGIASRAGDLLCAEPSIIITNPSTRPAP